MRRSCCPDAQIIRHVQAPQLEAQDEDDPNSFPELQVVRAGIFFRSVDPRERRRRALLLRHARPLCRFSTCRSAVCDRIILDSALQGESGKNRVLVEIALSSIEKATLGTPKSSLRDKRGSDIELRCSCRRDGARRSAKDCADHIL